MTTFEIRSYSNNGASWEWNGDGWDATGATADEALEASAKSGDWSAYGAGEECCLRAFDADDEQQGELIFTPNVDEADRHSYY